MNLKQLRHKYKQILEDPEDENHSEEDWIMAQNTINQRKKQVPLNEISLANNPTQDHYDYVLLKNKEKLAQSLANLAKKDHEIKELKTQIQRYQDQKLELKKNNKLLENQMSQLQKNMQAQQDNTIELEKQINQKNRVIQSLKIDKELMMQQIDYYKEQLNIEKNKMNLERKKYKRVLKDIQMVEAMKSENQRQEEDIERLKFLLNQTQTYKNLPQCIQGCNFMGKPQKEADMWFPRYLIGQTQHFLKKNQLPYNNKELLSQFVKFVDKQIKRSQKQTTKKVKRLYTEKKRETQRKNNQTFCMYDTMTTQSLGKSNLKGSILRTSNRTSYFIDQKRGNETENKLTKSMVFGQDLESRKICKEIIEQCRKGIKDLLNQSTIKKKKIIKLVDWACDSLAIVMNQNKLSQRKISFQ